MTKKTTVKAPTKTKSKKVGAVTATGVEALGLQYKADKAEAWARKAKAGKKSTGK